MRRLIGSDIDVRVESGFLYLPLLFDPAIEREAEATLDLSGCQEETRSVVLIEGKHFVKAISLHSLVSNSEQIGKNYYEQARSNVLGQFAGNLGSSDMLIGWKLITIIFEVMPYFIKKSRGFERRKFSKVDMLKLIAEKVDIPPIGHEPIDTLFDMRPLQDTLKKLEKLDTTCKPPSDGFMSTRDLEKWLLKALEAQVIEEERARLRNEVFKRTQLVASVEESMDILLHIAESGSLELHGFGFERIGEGDDYFIYKRTGEYMLEDYYGRRYLFPDCRVAIPTFSPFKPVVLERYKHPFLYAHDYGQEICMRGFSPPAEFDAGSAIHLLEEGINALLHGYDARRRNGYHSLDQTRQYIKTVEFDDYRVPLTKQTDESG